MANIVEILLKLKREGSEEAKSFIGDLDQIGSTAKTVVAAFGLWVTLPAIIGGARAALREYAEGEQQLRRLEAAIRSQGAAMETLEPRINQLVERGGRWGISNNEVAQSITNLINRSFTLDESLRTVDAAITLAASEGISYSEAIRDITQATLGQVRAGSRFGQLLSEQRGALDEAGTQARRLEIILQRLGQLAPGVDAQVGTINQSTAELGVAWQETLEAIGGFLNKALQVPGALRLISEEVKNLTANLRAITGQASPQETRGLRIRELEEEIARKEATLASKRERGQVAGKRTLSGMFGDVLRSSALSPSNFFEPVTKTGGDLKDIGELETEVKTLTEELRRLRAEEQADIDRASSAAVATTPGASAPEFTRAPSNESREAQAAREKAEAALTEQFLQQSYEKRQIDLETYLAARNRLVEFQTHSETEFLRAEIAKQDSIIHDPSARSTEVEAATTARQALADKLAAIEAVKQMELNRIAEEGETERRNLSEASGEIDLQLAQARGAALVAQQMEIQRTIAQLRKSIAGEGTPSPQDQAKLDNIQQLLETQALFGDTMQRTTQDIAFYEDKIRNVNELEAAGTITRAQAQEQIEGYAEAITQRLGAALPVLQATRDTLAALGADTTEMDAQLQQLVTTLNQFEDASSNNFLESFQDRLREIQNEFTLTGAVIADVLGNVVNTALDGATDAIMGLITGTRTWQQAFSEAGLSIARDIIRIVLQYTIGRATMAALNAAFGATEAAAGTGHAAGMAAAWAPAAINASIASFGAAAITGLAAYATAQAIGTGISAGLSGAGAAAGGVPMARGGIVTEGTGPKSDDVPAWLSKGEAVIPAASVNAVGQPFIWRLIQGQIKGPGFASGGIFGFSIPLFGGGGGGGDLSGKTIEVEKGRVVDGGGGFAPSFSLPLFGGMLDLGFASGGMVRGGRKRITVNEHGEEFVLSADATQAFGENFLNALNRGVLDLSHVEGGIASQDFNGIETSLRTELEAGANGARPGGGAGGVPPQVRVEPAPVRVAILNDRSELRRFMEEEGIDMVVDAQSGRTLELGVEK